MPRRPQPLALALLVSLVTWRAGVGLRAFPTRDLTIALGYGIDRIGQPGLGGESSDPFIGLEWQLPLGSPDWQLSVFVEREVSSAHIAGLRMSYGMGATPRDRARATGWRRLR